MSHAAETGKTGLITGGSAGLGLAIARAAVAEGMRVTLVGRDEARLDAAATGLQEKHPGSSVATIAADLAVAGESARVAAAAKAEQPLDFVCHAAGLSSRGRVADTSRADFERSLAINFLAAAELASALSESLTERSGRFVLIGSLATRVAPAYLGAYPASKHPVAALAQQLRIELGPAGLRTLLVLPGPIAREDAGSRYTAEAAGLPESAKQPGGGAKVKAIDPNWLARQILANSRRGRRELVVPAKARLLFTLSQLSPTLGDWLLRKSMKSDPPS
ncbi:MAG: SDR family NAD(P)-dependent oxidoreductase [Planctomycetota bacterium]